MSPTAYHVAMAILCLLLIAKTVELMHSAHHWAVKVIGWVFTTLAIASYVVVECFAPR